MFVCAFVCVPGVCASLTYVLLCTCLRQQQLHSKPTVCVHLRTGFADGVDVAGLSSEVDPDSPKVRAAGWASSGLESSSMAETVYMWRRQMSTSNAHGAGPVPSVYVTSDFPCEAGRLHFLAEQALSSTGPVPLFVQASNRKTHHSDMGPQPSVKSSNGSECVSSGSYEETDWPMWYTHASAHARSLSDTMAQIVLLSSCDGLVMGHSGFPRLALLWGDYPDGDVTQLPLHRGVVRHGDDGAGVAGSYGPLAIALLQPSSPIHSITFGVTPPRAGPANIYTATEWKESSALLSSHKALRWWDFERQRHTKGIDPALGAASVAACVPYLAPIEAVVAAAQERVAATLRVPGGGWITTVLFNSGYLEMTQSFACNLRLLPHVLDRTLFIAADVEAETQFRDFAASQGFTVHVVLWHAASEFERSMEYAETAYYRFMLARACLELELVTVGVHVHIAEADAFWVRDGVVVALENAAEEGAGYDVLWTDDKAFCGNIFSDHVSGGTAMLNATRGSQMVLRYLAQEWGAQLSTLLDVEGAVKTSMNNEQHIWQHMHDTGMFGAKWLRLRASAFPSGLWYQKAGRGGDVSRTDADMAILQNNWEVGSAKKIERAKDWGQWFLDPNGRCLSPQEALPKHVDIGDLITTARQRLGDCVGNDAACDSASIARDTLTPAEVLRAIPFVRPGWFSNSAQACPDYADPKRGGCWQHMASTMHIPE